jgi:hypothetical protein
VDPSCSRRRREPRVGPAAPGVNFGNARLHEAHEPREAIDRQHRLFLADPVQAEPLEQLAQELRGRFSVATHVIPTDLANETARQSAMDFHVPNFCRDMLSRHIILEMFNKHKHF